MTVIAGPLAQCRWVAGCAGAVSLAVLHREGMRAIVGCVPICGGVTGCAVGAKHSSMIGRFAVATCAGRGRALEDAIGMAGAAGLVFVCAGQRE